MSSNLRVLTIEAAAKEFPGLTPTAIRRLVKSGEIPSRRVGVKYLLTPESVENWLNTPAPSEQEMQRGSIRAIN